MLTAGARYFIRSANLARSPNFRLTPPPQLLLHVHTLLFYPSEHFDASSPPLHHCPALPFVIVPIKYKSPLRIQILNPIFGASERERERRQQIQSPKMVHSSQMETVIYLFFILNFVHWLDWNRFRGLCVCVFGDGDGDAVVFSFRSRALLLAVECDRRPGGCVYDFNKVYCIEYIVGK